MDSGTGTGASADVECFAVCKQAALICSVAEAALEVH